MLLDTKANCLRSGTMLIAFLLAVVISTTARAETTLRVGYHSPLPIEKIDPYQNDFTLQTLLTTNIVEPLISRIPDDPNPYRAAEKVSIEDRSLTFTLREGLKWSDGAPVIPQDFINGLKRAIHPTSSNQEYVKLIVGAKAWLKAGGEGEVEGLQVIDDRTLKITLTQSSTELFDEGRLLLAPMPSHIPLDPEKSWASQTLVSNGPYVISPDSSDERIILERNPHYAGLLSPSIERIELPAGPIDTVLRDFNAGNMDLILDVPFKQLAWVRDNAGDKFLRSREFSGLFTGVNMRAAPFNDRRVRQALILASNRKEISNAAFSGTGETLYGVAHETLSQAPEIAKNLASISREEAVASAKALLLEAGYSEDNPLKVRLGYFDILTFRTVAFALKHDWSTVGVQVDLVRFDTNFTDLIHAANNSDIDTWVYTFSVTSDKPSALLHYLNNYVNGSFFLSFYSNEKYNALIKMALEENGDGLLPLLAQAERMLAADAVSNPIGWYPGGALVSDQWRASVIKEFTSAAYHVEFSNIQAE